MGNLLQLAWTFFKIGLIFFGGGYVLIPLLRQIMIDQYHWMTLKEFLDGVALSQLTPGPLAMLATFTGYKAAGFAGAFVATFFIFLPCTGLMIFISRHYQRLRHMEMVKVFLDGILPAVLGLVAATAYALGKSSLSTVRDFLFLGAAFLLLRFTPVSPMVVILGAGVIGYLFHLT